MDAHSLGKPFALLSVTDKTDLIPFARKLVDQGYDLLSTGGTAKALSEAGLTVTQVQEYTGHPEMMDGRIKTLNPKVHGGILFDRTNPGHVTDAHKAGIRPIDVVVINLYDFQKLALEQNKPLDEAIEHIDIGGPCMIRAAAKNWKNVLVVTSPKDYGEAGEALASGLTDRQRQTFAAKAFAKTAAYDTMVSTYFQSSLAAEQSDLPEQWQSASTKIMDLRYGENPHQKAAFYGDGTGTGLAGAKVLQGKELSYNNLLDLDAAFMAVRDLSKPGVVIVKHTNPCGVAVGDDELVNIYSRALSCDPKSAFGGIVALNRVVDGETARKITEVFTECIAAPGYLPEAREIFSQKKNLRLVEMELSQQPAPYATRSVFGGTLVQERDTLLPRGDHWQTVTDAKPDQRILDDLELAMTVVGHVKSNGIVLVKDGQTIGVGAGQMSRIDAANIARDKAKEFGFGTKDCVLASDAFFPFGDTVEAAAKIGVKAVIQPGGSMRDQESIDAANKNNMVMVFTSRRHFRH